MKTKKNTKITLMLAAAVVSTALGGVALNSTTAVADAEKYAITDVFSTTNENGVAATTIGEGENANNVTAFELTDEAYMYMKRNLAFKWYSSENTAEYFTLKFSFKDLNFEKITVSVDSPSAWATKDDKVTNEISFTKDGTAVKAKVNGGDKEVTLTNVTQEDVFTIKLGETADCEDGEFTVTLTEKNGTAHTLDSFTNIGANYATYSFTDKDFPLKVTADLGTTPATDAKTTLLLWEVNGQSFDGLVSDSSAWKAVDDAKPVLVVNENVDGFLLGTAFSLDYTVLDVLKSKNLTKTLEYYQYNPTVELNDEAYKTLTTSTYFMETTYKVEGSDNEYTSVYREEEKASVDGVGREFVSIRLEVTDGTFTGDTAAKYDLSWYANADAVVEKEGAKYIVLDRNTEGATYKTHITVANDPEDAEKKVNVKSATLDQDVKDFEDGELAKAAKDVYAGSNSYIYFPSFKWLIDDNNGYRNLKFTISYKTPSSSSASTSSSLSYNGLKLAVSEEGTYEFKIFANDKAGNTMKYALDGELVDVTSGNVWDIEQIPSFKFTIANKGLMVEDEDDAYMDTEILDKSYTFEDLKVVGASNLKEAYALYKVNLDAYNTTATKTIDADALASVTYEDIAKNLDNAEFAEAKTKAHASGDYFDYYLDVYSALVAKNVDGATAAAIKACFVKVGEQGDRINNADDTWEKYEWNPSSQSFKTVETGEYLLLADFWEAEITAQRAVGYKLVVVQSEKDKIAGETEWLKNNVVSVVLFSIAGVMLILIIILLLIKPSDETLEDVDNAAAKAAKKEKKNKKEGE